MVVPVAAAAEAAVWLGLPTRVSLLSHANDDGVRLIQEDFGMTESQSDMHSVDACVTVT